MAFNNDSSLVHFIPKNQSVEDIIAKDEQELQGRGSFDAIADRIKEIIDYAAKQNTYGPVSLPVDDIVQVTFYGQTKGFQQCPFSSCTRMWSDVVQMQGRQGRKLTINRGTEHLARHHHFLEKENEYGIGAKEFYDNFMP